MKIERKKCETYLQINSENVDSSLSAKLLQLCRDERSQEMATPLGVKDGRVRRAVAEEDSAVGGCAKVLLLLQDALDPLGDPDGLHHEGLGVQGE